MPPKIGGRNRSENVGMSRETKMLGVETYDIMAFFTCVCKTRQDKTRQDNVLFGVLHSPMYIDFIQII